MTIDPGHGRDDDPLSGEPEEAAEGEFEEALGRTESAFSDGNPDNR